MRRQMIALDDEDDGEMAGTNRWMVSYADFITLLFVLFLVLYAKLPKLSEAAVSQVAATPQQAQQSHPAPDMRPVQPPRIVDMPQEAPKAEAAPADASPANAPPDPRQVLLGKMQKSFGDLVSAGNITLVERKDGVVLEIADTSLFSSGTAQPAPQAQEIINKIAEAIGPGKNAVIVEGHTDNVPIKTAQYPSNWELSSARAASVVRALQERGVNADRLTASGLAHTKPRSSNDTEQGRRENRRVSLIVQSD
jgi:chemotaxis protein MotB